MSKQDSHFFNNFSLVLGILFAVTIGLFAFAAAAVPPTLLTLLATQILQQPALAPVLLAVWCVVAYALGRLGFVPVRRIFDARRENLGLVI